MNHRLLEVVWEHDELAELDPAARRLALRSLLSQELGIEDVSDDVSTIADFIDGYGPLSATMEDDNVTDVLVNAPDEVWIESHGILEQTAIRFSGQDHLWDFVHRMLGRAGVRADVSQPIAGGRLPDGSRLAVVLPPIAPHGPLLAIRKFPRDRLRLDQLVAREMLTVGEATQLASLVERGCSMLISGATGTGKTTLLNALLGYVPPGERVVTIEETPELAPSCAHWVSLVGRDCNIEDRGAIDLMTLVRAALRMRPDRIVVGEARGPEALAALAALSTGHEGSLLTVHARSGDDALSRMVALALQGSSGASEVALTDQVRRAFGAVAHLERAEGGRRRLAELRSVG